jgi:hypothetical protein
MYNHLRILKMRLKTIAAIATCFVLFAFNQQINAQSKVDTKARRPIPARGLVLNRITPALKKSNLLPCANSNSFYVNDNSQSGDVYTTAVGNDANCGTPDAPFATIGHAISVAGTNDIIFVDAGTYVEDITLNMALRLRGANYSINPNTGTRNAESIIEPATSDPDPFSPTEELMFYMTADAGGSTIDGFTFNGDNPALTSTVNFNGANVDAAEGIVAWEGIANLQVSNNIIKNVSYAGVDFDNYYNSGAVTYGNLITSNLFDNILPSQYGIGIIIYDNAYTTISNNVMTRVRIGVQTGNFYQADPDGSHTITNNTIESARIGIWHNLAYSGASSFNITSNTITTYPDSPRNNGIEISSIQSAVGVNVTNNNISGAQYGINLWNCPTTNTVTVTGGTLSNCGVGIFPNNWEGYSSDAASSAYVVTGVSIQNAGIAGIYVQDDNNNDNNATVSLSISGNTVINNSTTGLKVEGAGASVSFSGSPAASFSGQSIYIDQVSNGTDVPAASIDATNVSFGGSTGATMNAAQLYATEDKINHKPDYSALGLVTFKTNNIFVTPNSYISPYSTTPSVQRGIDASSDTWTLNVNAGTYNEALIVNKQLTIKGAQAGVLGKGRSGPETIIDPNATLSHGFNIVTDNVTIDGFTITNSSAYPSADAAHERYGVVTLNKQGSGNFTGISVKNNIITRQFKAVDFNYTDNFTISNNWLHGDSDPYNYGCTWVSSYGSTSSNGTMSNNDLDGYGSAIEIQGNGSQPVSSLSISENRSTGSQYVFFGLTNSSVLRNTVLNVTSGSHVFIGGGCSNDIYSENFFDSGVSNGISVSNNFGAGINSNITVNHNHITGHNTATHYEVVVAPGSYTDSLDVTCNWFGSTYESVIVPKISGPASYLPYLMSGTDSDPSTAGFQPGNNTCKQPLMVSLNSKKNVSCNGAHDGIIDINVTGGSGNYSYNWTPTNKTTQDLTGLSANTYAVTVTDVTFGTIATLSVSITQPTPLSVTSSNIVEVSCYGGSNGKFTVTASGGISPYKYSFDGDAFKVKHTFTNLSANTYNAVAKDSNRCTSLIDVTITQPAPLVLSASHTDVNCSHVANGGSITATGSGGASNYVYKLVEANKTNRTGVFKKLSPGTYTLVLKDQNGCTKDTSITIQGCGAIAADGNSASEDASATSLTANLLPNPTTLQFALVLRSKTNDRVQIRVVDVAGKEVYLTTGSANQTYYFGQNFSTGIYIVQIIQNKNVQTLKAIKSN